MRPDLFIIPQMFFPMMMLASIATILFFGIAYVPDDSLLHSQIIQERLDNFIGTDATTQELESIGSYINGDEETFFGLAISEYGQELTCSEIYVCFGGTFMTNSLALSKTNPGSFAIYEFERIVAVDGIMKPLVYTYIYNK